VQDTGVGDKTRTTLNEKPGKDEQRRIDGGKARSVKRDYRAQPRTTSKSGTQESEHLWEAEERARRTYVTFLDRRSWSMESESPVAYEEGRNGHCGGVGPLRNGRRNSISVRVAGEVGAPANPGDMAPTDEKVRVRMREGEREKARTLDDCDTPGSTGNLASNRSGRAGLKGERMQRLERIPAEEPCLRKVTSRTQPSEEKERRCTVRLFGVNSLKEGAV
jgi:hypothetical protein